MFLFNGEDPCSICMGGPPSSAPNPHNGEILSPRDGAPSGISYPAVLLSPSYAPRSPTYTPTSPLYHIGDITRELMGAPWSPSYAPISPTFHGDEEPLPAAHEPSSPSPTLCVHGEFYGKSNKRDYIQKGFVFLLTAVSSLCRLVSMVCWPWKKSDSRN